MRESVSSSYSMELKLIIKKSMQAAQGFCRNHLDQEMGHGLWD